MPNSIDTHGQVFKNGTKTCLARLVDESASLITQADFDLASSSGECGANAVYTVYLLDQWDVDTRTPIAGHTNVGLDITDIIFDVLQTDDSWTIDDTGYNFKHQIDICAPGSSPFTVAGARYLVEFTLAPTSGQIIIVRYQLGCI